MDALTDPAQARPEDSRRADASARRLQREGYGPEVPGWTVALGSPDLAVRAEAAFLLGLSGATEAVAPLREALRDGEARVRVEAGLALARLGEREEGVPVLRAELDGEFFRDAPLRAARALAVLGDPSGYSRVRAALGSDLPSNRMEAIAALPAFLPFEGVMVDGGPIDPVGELIAGAAGDDEPLLRQDALRALAATKDPRVRGALEAARGDPDSSVSGLAQELTRTT